MIELWTEGELRQNSGSFSQLRRDDTSEVKEGVNDDQSLRSERVRRVVLGRGGLLLDHPFRTVVESLVSGRVLGFVLVPVKPPSSLVGSGSPNMVRQENQSPMVSC